MSTMHFVGVAMLILFIVIVFFGACQQSGMDVKQTVIAGGVLLGITAWLVTAIYLIVRH